MNDAEMVIATVVTRTAAGVTIRLDGENEALQKRYKVISNGVTLAAGNRVLAVKMSGTYIVIGKIT